MSESELLYEPKGKSISTLRSTIANELRTKEVAKRIQRDKKKTALKRKKLHSNHIDLLKTPKSTCTIDAETTACVKKPKPRVCRIKSSPLLEFNDENLRRRYIERVGKDYSEIGLKTYLDAVLDAKRFRERCFFILSRRGTDDSGIVLPECMTSSFITNDNTSLKYTDVVIPDYDTPIKSDSMVCSQGYLVEPPQHHQQPFFSHGHIQTMDYNNKIPMVKGGNLSSMNTNLNPNVGVVNGNNLASSFSHASDDATQVCNKQQTQSHGYTQIDNNSIASPLPMHFSNVQYNQEYYKMVNSSNMVQSASHHYVNNNVFNTGNIPLLQPVQQFHTPNPQASRLFYGIDQAKLDLYKTHSERDKELLQTFLQENRQLIPKDCDVNALSFAEKLQLLKQLNLEHDYIAMKLCSRIDNKNHKQELKPLQEFSMYGQLDSTERKISQDELISEFTQFDAKNNKNGDITSVK